MVFSHQFDAGPGLAATHGTSFLPSQPSKQEHPLVRRFKLAGAIVIGPNAGMEHYLAVICESFLLIISWSWHSLVFVGLSLLMRLHLFESILYSSNTPLMPSCADYTRADRGK